MKHRLFAESELAAGAMKAVVAGGVSLVVYHLQDGWFATQSSCTHLFASLAKGKIIDGCKVECPLHRARYDIKSGEVDEWANWPPGVVYLLNVARKKKALKTYPVSVDGGVVCVELPE